MDTSEASAEDLEDGMSEDFEAPSGELPEDADEADSEEASEAWRPPSSAANERRAPDYHAYTHQFDEVISAKELCDPEELARLRGYLDKQVQSLQGVVARLANRLQRRLMAQQNRSWEFDLEEGMLDAARLSRIIIDPFQPLSFKQEKDTNFRDTVVTLAARQFRLDARPADHDRRDLRRHLRAHARALRRQGRDPGFTTRAWKGGQSREAWLQSGKPPNPGRLNDLRHIIYKSADAPWRRARKISASC